MGRQGHAPDLQQYVQQLPLQQSHPTLPIVQHVDTLATATVTNNERVSVQQQLHHPGRENIGGFLR